MTAGPSQKANMLAGRLYLASDPELVAEQRHCRSVLERFNARTAGDRDGPSPILAELFGHLGTGTIVEPPLRCDYGYNIRIGDRSFVNYGAVMLDTAVVEVGDDVQIATGVQLITATHPLDAATRRDGWESGSPVTIGDGAWLGAGVIVCPGVTIGEDTVIGAGSVVAGDIPGGVLAVGNPCRPIRDLR